ncbi:hypothetical protein [Endothiovibrio diazotrophicus]
MEPRNWIGIIIILTGVIVQPVGWMFAFWLQILSFILIFIGVFIFLTQKYIEKTEESEFGSGSGGSHAMPGDIHDYSGWEHGGRSESWSSDQSDGGGGGD